MRKWPTYGFYEIAKQLNEQTNKTTLKPAIDFVGRNFETRAGATDINEALKFALKVAKKVKLVSQELNHIGVIALLFRQIGGHSSIFVLFCSFEDFSL